MNFYLQNIQNEGINSHLYSVYVCACMGAVLRLHGEFTYSKAVHRNKWPLHQAWSQQTTLDSNTAKYTSAYISFVCYLRVRHHVEAGVSRWWMNGHWMEWVATTRMTSG
jgi:hypothetical protein